MCANARFPHWKPFRHTDIWLMLHLRTFFFFFFIHTVFMHFIARRDAHLTSRTYPGSFLDKHHKGRWETLKMTSHSCVESSHISLTHLKQKATEVKQAIVLASWRRLHFSPGGSHVAPVVFVLWLLNLWGEVDCKEWRCGSSLDSNPIKENTDGQTKRQNNKNMIHPIWKAKPRCLDHKPAYWHNCCYNCQFDTDTTLKISSAFLFTIFTLKDPWAA